MKVFYDEILKAIIENYFPGTNLLPQAILEYIKNTEIIKNTAANNIERYSNLTGEDLNITVLDEFSRSNAHSFIFEEALFKTLNLDEEQVKSIPILKANMVVDTDVAYISGFTVCSNTKQVTYTNDGLENVIISEEDFLKGTRETSKLDIQTEKISVTNEVLRDENYQVDTYCSGMKLATPYLLEAVDETGEVKTYKLNSGNEIDIAI